MEVVPHPGTAQDAVQRAIDFYKSIGKAPVLIKKETPGFLANRLQAAILAEAYSLVNRGIASAQDVDTAVSTGPGLRWALTGPYTTNVLAGGNDPDAFGHFMSHLGPAVSGWKKDMDENKFSFEETETQQLTEKVKPFVEQNDFENVRRDMGDGLIDLLEMKSTKSALK